MAEPDVAVVFPADNVVFVGGPIIVHAHVSVDVRIAIVVGTLIYVRRSMMTAPMMTATVMITTVVTMTSAVMTSAVVAALGISGRGDCKPERRCDGKNERKFLQHFSFPRVCEIRLPHCRNKLVNTH